MSNPHFDIDEIRDRLDCHKLMAHHGIDTGGKSMVKAPFRDERTPSMSISKDGKLWRDFGSAEGGSVIDLQMQLCGCDLAAAIQSCAEIAGVQGTEGQDWDGSPLSRLPPPVRKDDEIGRPLSLEKARSLRVNLKDFIDSPSTAAARSLAWIPKEYLTSILKKGWLGATHDKKLAYLMRRGFKARTNPTSSRGDRWVFGKAKENMFVSYKDKEDIYNPEKKTLIITEGESDAIAATMLWGNTHKVGGCLSCSILPPLEMLYPLMRGVDEVRVIFDGDDAGRKGSGNLLRYLNREFVNVTVRALATPDGEDLKSIFMSGATNDIENWMKQ